MQVTPYARAHNSPDATFRAETKQYHFGNRVRPSQHIAAELQASAPGKAANRQTLASLTFTRSEVPMMIALCLLLPESLTSVVAASVAVEARPRAKTSPTVNSATLASECANQTFNSRRRPSVNE